MNISIGKLAILLLLITGIALGGCTNLQAISQAAKKNDATATKTTKGKASIPTPAQEITIPSQFSNLPRLTGKATVVMTVKGAPITIEVDGSNAPITAGNFIDLVQRGFYTGLAFHRVIREPQPFVVQGGDPQSKDPKFPPQGLGTGNFIDPVTKQVRYIPLEIVPKGEIDPTYSQTFQTAAIAKVPELRHTRGALAMARSKPPDSASSQFYFALADLSFLDGNYAVFGYVTQGMDVVDKIQQGDRIESAKVTQGIENFKESATPKKTK